MINYPIEHWSYSALMLFLRNRFAFQQRYIFNINNYKSSPAAIIGKAGHKALQLYYSGEPVEKVIEEGLNYIQKIKDEWVNWGLTGSREICLKKFSFALNAYLEEVSKPHKILFVEQTISTFYEYGGEELALPLKAIVDLCTENEQNEIEIIDHKFVSTYTKSDEEKGTLAMQAVANYFVVKKELGREPKRMIYNECKISQNKNKDSQVQPYIIEFDKHEDDKEVFINLINLATKELAKPDCQYFPNFQDAFNADETFADYKATIISAEQPILVEHKTNDYQFKEKNFVPSALTVDKKYYTEEEKIKAKFMEFGIPVEMSDTHNGSSVIQYTLKPPRGRKMSDFNKYGKDIALALKAGSIRIQAPIMGTDLVGIEVPNPNREVIKYQSMTSSGEGSLNIPIGVDVYGEPLTQQLSNMPHLLIAGATGSGKSVMINVVISALLDQNTPDQLKLVLIDPKRVELAHFKKSANLLCPVIYDTQKARRALYWLVDEMEARYKTLEDAGARNIDDFNDNNAAKMGRVVVVIDEFADLMIRTKEEKNAGVASAENAIVLLTQKARAIGIHIVLGTQRPSVDVVTGLIKANLPARICFMTSSRIDSQVVLDQIGAEDLLGKGDMLFLDPSTSKITRLQGYFK